MLVQVNTSVKENLEKALYLSPEQMQSINSFNFAATGFYGVGKTTALEVAIDKIVDDPAQFPHPKIVFITWDNSEYLKTMFEDKFEKIQEEHPNLKDCLKVYSLEEVCAEYQVKYLEVKYEILPRDKVDVINDLCKKLIGNYM